MKIISTINKVETPFLNFKLTEYEDRNGKKKMWYWAERPGQRNAVVIAATVPNDSYPISGASMEELAPRIVVIKEYRVPLGDYEWGFPAGLIDGDEPVENTVRRELKEETGLEVEEILKISPFIYNSTGMTTEAVAMAFVKAKGELNDDLHEASEEIESFLMTMTEVHNLLLGTNMKFGAKAWIVLDRFARTGTIL